jgi:hypothetical protein
MDEIVRRQFISGAVSIAAVAGSMGICTPSFGASGDGQGAPYQTLSQSQADTYAAWSDLLVNGAADAGVARFVDKAISNPYVECLAMSRFFVNPPLSKFYLAGIAGIDLESQTRFSGVFITLERDQQLTIVDAAIRSSTQAWHEPDPNLFYLMSRSDAVDVVYGTQQGFSNLKIPYLPHIAPTQPW